MNKVLEEGISRRNFLKVAGLTGVSVGLAACAIPPEELPAAVESAAQATACLLYTSRCV